MRFCDRKIKEFYFAGPPRYMYRLLQLAESSFLGSFLQLHLLVFQEFPARPCFNDEII